MGRVSKGKGKPLVPTAKGKPKGKPFAPAMRGAPPDDDDGDELAPARPMRGRVAVAVPVLEAPSGRRRMDAPPVRQMAPPRASEYEERPSSRAPVMQQRGAPATMERLRRGKVAF